MAEMSVEESCICPDYLDTDVLGRTCHVRVFFLRDAPTLIHWVGHSLEPSIPPSKRKVSYQRAQTYVPPLATAISTLQSLDIPRPLLLRFAFLYRMSITTIPSTSLNGGSLQSPSVRFVCFLCLDQCYWRHHAYISIDPSSDASHVFVHSIHQTSARSDVNLRSPATISSRISNLNASRIAGPRESALHYSRTVDVRADGMTAACMAEVLVEGSFLRGCVRASRLFLFRSQPPLRTGIVTASDPETNVRVRDAPPQAAHDLQTERRFSSTHRGAASLSHPTTQKTVPSVLCVVLLSGSSPALTSPPCVCIPVMSEDPTCMGIHPARYNVPNSQDPGSSPSHPSQGEHPSSKPISRTTPPATALRLCPPIMTTHHIADTLVEPRDCTSATEY